MNKSHSVMVYNSSNMLLNSFLQQFVEWFCISVHMEYLSVVYFFFFGNFCVCLQCQNNACFIVDIKWCLLTLKLLDDFKNYRYLLFFKYLVQFTSEAIRARAFLFQKLLIIVTSQSHYILYYFPVLYFIYLQSNIYYLIYLIILFFLMIQLIYQFC